MGYIKNIQAFLEKDGFDFGRSDITLYNFHTQLLMVVAIQGIFFGQRDSYLRLVMPLCSIAITITGLTLQGLNIYSGLSTSDYSKACESFCYCVLLGTMGPLYIGFLSNKTQILSLIEHMNDDFVQICNLGPRYRDSFLETQLLVWKLFIGWGGFIGLVGLLYIVYPIAILMYQSLLATQNENMQRPLIFPLWLPYDDPYRSPNYELFFLLEMTYTVLFVLSFGGYVYTLFHFLLHNYIMMDMIILDFEVIFKDLDENVATLRKDDPRRVAVQQTLNKRLERIVTWHISVFSLLYVSSAILHHSTDSTIIKHQKVFLNRGAIKTISMVFRPSLVYQLMFSSVAICLMFYQIVEKLENGGFDLLFSLLAVAACLQLWIPCYLGSLIRNKGFAVGDACWNCGWHETSLGKMIRVDILIILMRAQMPIFIKYTGQPVIQLETFSAIMSTSYSYFNMLRQSQNNN